MNGIMVFRNKEDKEWHVWTNILGDPTINNRTWKNIRCPENQTEIILDNQIRVFWSLRENAPCGFIETLGGTFFVSLNFVGVKKEIDKITPMYETLISVQIIV